MDLEAIRRKIMENVQGISADTGAEDAARASADRTGMVSDLGGALSQIASANSVSRGGRAPDMSFFDQMKAKSREAIKNAVEARQGKAKSAMDAGKMELDVAQNQAAADQQVLDNAYRQSKLEQDAAQFKTAQANSAEDRKLARELQSNERVTAREIRAGERADDRAAREAIDLRERSVPGIGIALTSRDAAELKNIDALKKSFDSNINKMIELRTKHGGGALLNRDDVAAGKQASRDLLLAYKNLASLGVLSAKDTQILEDIIPSDPLAYDFVPGQDPIMTKLQNFKNESDSDYKNRVNLRIDPGSARAAAPMYPKTVTNDKGETATVANEQDLREAMAEGFK